MHIIFSIDEHVCRGPTLLALVFHTQISYRLHGRAILIVDVAKILNFQRGNNFEQHKNFLLNSILPKKFVCRHYHLLIEKRVTPFLFSIMNIHFKIYL